MSEEIDYHAGGIDYAKVRRIVRDEVRKAINELLLKKGVKP